MLALFHVVGYQTTNDDLAAAFETARTHLKPGGVLLFDYWYGPAVLTQRPAVRIKRASDAALEVTRLASRNCCRTGHGEGELPRLRARQATGAVSEHREEHGVRYLFLPELEYLLAQQGLKLEHSEEWMTGRPLATDTS